MKSITDDFCTQFGKREGHCEIRCNFLPQGAHHQMKQEKVLAPWEKFSGGFINSDAFIETLYNSLTRHQGEFMKHN